jgi:beta-glucanase (GH16 family)
MPRDFEYGGWPTSGEIDIMESRGNLNYPKANGGGPETFGSTLHWGSDWTTNQFWRTRAEYTIPNGTLADDFHTYGLYWDDKVIYTYLDNDTNRVLFVNHSQMSYWERGEFKGRSNPWQYSPNKNAPFDSEFYLILNVAVGGTIGYFADGVANKPWKDSSSRASAEFLDNKGQWINSWKGSSAMQIDSVKIWDLQPNDPIAE